MMKLNVGLSRKVSDANFGSKGGNIGLEVEIDTSVMGDALKLKGQIHHLFCLVREALAQELENHDTGSLESNEPIHSIPLAGNDFSGSTTNGSRRLASEKQLSLIQGLIRKGKVAFQPLLDQRNVDSFNELTIQQASQLITELKEVVR